MNTTTLKSDLRDIADRISETASYSDAMYELYVRMKIAKGRAAAARGEVVSHEDLKRRLAR